MTKDIDYIAIHFWREQNYTDVDFYDIDAHFMGYERFHGNVKKQLEGLFDLLGLQLKHKTDEDLSFWTIGD